jgi:hypothetical protein
VNSCVHLLMDAVNPVRFMEKLRKAAVSRTEWFGEGRERRAEDSSAILVDCPNRISYSNLAMSIRFWVVLGGRLAFSSPKNAMGMEWR